MSQSETGLSAECQQNRHADCKTQNSCVCNCHDPLRPQVNPRDERPDPVGENVSNVT